MEMKPGTIIDMVKESTHDRKQEREEEGEKLDEEMLLILMETHPKLAHSLIRKGFTESTRALEGLFS
jgi:hypothetical protein